MAGKAKSNPYSVHPGVESNIKWISSLREKTGRSLDEWLAFIAKKGPKTEEARRDWLKDQQGLGTNAAWWMAERSFGKGAEEDTPEGYLRTALVYVEDMFSGGKSGLRPIYDRLVVIAQGLGDDVRICPCKTIVPLYRTHVFAEIKPSTRTRIDFGFALAKYHGKLPKRLVDTGGAAKKDRITHKIALTSLDDLDHDFNDWLQIAYELDS